MQLILHISHYTQPYTVSKYYNIFLPGAIHCDFCHTIFTYNTAKCAVHRPVNYAICIAGSQADAGRSRCTAGGKLPHPGSAL